MTTQEDARPTHSWNDPDGDGHDCADCPPDSMWKCDQLAHLNLADLLTDEQKATLDRTNRENAAKMRQARVKARTMPL